MQRRSTSWLAASLACALLAHVAGLEARADQGRRAGRDAVRDETHVREEEVRAGEETTGQDDAPVDDAGVEDAPTDADPVQQQYEQEAREDTAAGIAGLAPDDITSQLRIEWIRGLLDFDPIARPWKEFNDSLRWSTGLSLGLAYTVVYQAATDGLGPTSAAAGDFDFFGSWHLIGLEGDDDGRLGFRTEARHDFGGIPPSELNESVGSIVRTTNGFSVRDFDLRELWWQQNLAGGRAYFRAGKIAQRDFFARSRFQSDNFFFMNQVFSSSLAVPFPSTGPGIAGFVSATDWMDVGAGVGLANPTDDSRLVDLFDDDELFGALELAFRSNIEGWGPGNYRFTLTHSDGTASSSEGGAAFSLSFDQQIGKVVPFVRYSFADRPGLTSISDVVTAGVGVFDPLGNEGDVFGVAFAWIHPDRSALRDEYVFESFYRLQLTSTIQLTPDLQIIFDPTFNGEDDVVAVFGLRVRVQY